jgi:hypothetical protein
MSRETSFFVVLQSLTTVAAAATDTGVVPQRPIRKGRITHFTCSIFDPIYGSATAHPDSFAVRMGAKIFIGGKPITGSSSTSHVPISSLIGTREKPEQFDLDVDSSSEISAEFKSLDTSTCPALKVILVAHVAEG